MPLEAYSDTAESAQVTMYPTKTPRKISPERGSTPAQCREGTSRHRKENRQHKDVSNCKPTLKVAPTRQGTKARREDTTTIVAQRSATTTSLTKIKDKPSTDNGT
jgi:hypothetical protein